MVESITDYAASLLWRGLAQAVEHDLRVETYANVQDLDVSWHEGSAPGRVLSVVSDDVNQLERFLDTGARVILHTFWTVVFVGAVFAATSWTLTLLAFLPVPVIVVGSIVFQRRLEPLYAGVRARAGDVSATISTNLGGLSTIKAFTAEAREVERVRDVSAGYRDANLRTIRWSSAFVPLIRMAILAGFTSTLLLGGWLVINGRLEVGLYTILVFMTQRLLWPLTDLGETLDLYQRAMASTRRIFALMSERGDTRPGAGTLALPVRGRLELRGVRFGYADGPDVLRGLDLVVPAGETHAVVGTTGAGKSSLLRLVLRFSDPREGEVLLDGTDVRELGWDALRGAIGYVSQDVFLFHGTVRDNLAYGRVDATDAAGAGGRTAGRGRRLHHRAAARLRHRGRRARADAVGRAAPADRPRPGDPARPGPAGARRGDVGGGHRDGGRDPAFPGRGHRARGPRSSSRTGCRPSGTRTGSGCWPAAAWPSPGRTTSSSPPAGSTPACGPCRSARRSGRERRAR